MALNQNLKNLQTLLSAMETDHLSKSDFTEAFRYVIDFVKRIEDKNEKEFKGMLSAIEDTVKKIEEKYTNRVDEYVEKTGGKVIDYCSKEMERMMEEHNGKMSDFDSKMEEMEDKKENDAEEMVSKVIEKSRQPIIDEVEKSIPQLSIPIRDALELLSGDERLDKSAIKGLDEYLEYLVKTNTNPKNTISSFVGGSKTVFIDDEIPSGLIDGNNKDFTINYTPVPGSLKVYIGGARQKLTDDYTISNKTITFVLAPAEGSNILVDYRR